MLIDGVHGKLVNAFDSDGEDTDDPDLCRSIVLELADGTFAVHETPEGLVWGPRQ